MRLAVLTAWWLLCAPLAQGQDFFDEAHSLRFAAHLFSTARYDLAKLEYKRLAAVKPCSDSVQMLLIKSFRLTGDACGGLQRFNECYDTAFDDDPEKCREWLKLNLLCNPEKKWEERVASFRVNSVDRAYLRMNADLMNERYDSAKVCFSFGLQRNFEAFDAYTPTFRLLSAAKHKSPLLAAALSTAVPGSGKIYTGRWQDGLVAFALIGANAYHAYRGFDYNGVKSVRFWVFGSLGLGFYLGNVYGSYASAKKYNRKTHEQVEASVRRLFLDVP